MFMESVRKNQAKLLFSVVLLLSSCLLTSANVVLIGNNVTRSFDDIEANFAPAIKSSGECGVLHTAKPLDACSDLTNEVPSAASNCSSPFALIIRGGCGFEDKVRTAQKAGFHAAIVYDNDEDGVLVAMAGNAAGIKIHAVFVSKPSGLILEKYAGLTDVELWIIPSFENSAWSIMAISFISLLAMSAVLATCFFVRRHRIRREVPRASRVREFHGMKFHAFCVDSWLTTWRTFCPVCKRDARTSTGEPPASECTPLLSSAASLATSSALSSFRSSIASSSAIQIARSPSVSFSNSHANAYMQQFVRSSHRQSPSISVSRSSLDLRNASSQRSHASYLVSPHSMGYPSASPLNTRYMSPYIPSPSNASPSLLGSSSHHHRPLHYSESATSFSPFASAQSLPDC